MSDYSESGAQPVEDAAVPDPPTVDEVLAKRDRAEDDDSAEAPAADPTYDEPGDNPWLRRTTTDRAVVVGIQP